jgi:uncharacterized PurR-regulated membrane protein YhhQ (DUF165 family)
MQPKILIGMYLAAIVAANLLVAAFGPAISVVNAFAFVALDLTSRDRLHEAWHGRGLAWKMALLIATGSLLSYALNAGAGRIALASFVAFAVSATLDTLVYAALGWRAYFIKVNGSNVVSAAVDSILFPALAFGLPLLWPIVLGQFVAKTVGGALWAWLLARRRLT